jgi:hypothetical protein
MNNSIFIYILLIIIFISTLKAGFINREGFSIAKQAGKYFFLLFHFAFSKLT